jgi:hypothetical protein
MAKNPDKFDKWAYSVLEKYQKILKLEHFHPLQLEYKKSSAGAECQFNYPYSTITIRYGDPLKDYWKDGNIEMATKMLVHELCHMLTDPLYAKATSIYKSRNEVEDERERLTDTIANIILSL